MKIYFNRRPAPGPWGGGSKVLSSIVSESTRRKHEVYFEEDIRKNTRFDIYFCMDPRQNQTVGYQDIIKHRETNTNAKIVQRVGDLGTHGKPELLDLVKRTSELSDALIFPSEWAKNYLSSKNKRCYVIPNAPLPEFFVKSLKEPSETLKIVTHHWSNNSMKGFDIYENLDIFCEVGGRKNFDFLFVGRKPGNVVLKNQMGPQGVENLVKILPRNHVYVTASKQEAGANHVLEALAMGLPVLYHTDGGSINEYCKEFGFSYENFEELKQILLNKKDDLMKISKTLSYTRSSVDMSREYLDLLERIHEDKHKH